MVRIRSSTTWYVAILGVWIERRVRSVRVSKFETSLVEKGAGEMVLKGTGYQRLLSSGSQSGGQPEDH